MRDTFGALSFKFRGASDGTTDEIRDRVLGFVKGKRQDDLVKLNERVLPTLLGKIRPEARRLLDLHRDGGRATYIVSAAPHEIVEPLAHALGMTGGIGTRGQVVDGMYTGELDGPFCYGAGKVEAIRELARWEGLDLAQCYAYSDSASDLPMLQAVGHPVVVNPDGRLERHARRHGWPDRALQPAHQAGDPPHRGRRGDDRDRRSGVHRRRPSRPPAGAGSCRGSRFRGSGSGIGFGRCERRGVSDSWRLCATSTPRESHISPSSSTSPPWMNRLR